MTAGRERPVRPAAPTLALVAGIVYGVAEAVRQSAVPSPPGVPGDTGGSPLVLVSLGVVVAAGPVLAVLALARRGGWRARWIALTMGIWPFGAAGLWRALDRAGLLLESPQWTPERFVLPGLGVAVLAGLVALGIEQRWPRSARLPRRVVLGVVLAGVTVLGLEFRADGPRPGPERDGANVLVVTIDTLRRDALASYGGPWTTALDSVGGTAHEGWSVCSWTLPSVASLFSGTVPTGSGSDEQHGPDPAVAWWPEWLAARGWRTAAIVSNPYLRRRLGFGRGFESYDHAEERPWLEPVARTVLAEFLQAWLNARPDFDRADTLVGRALHWLDRAPDRSPWFLWVHLLDPHLPYTLRGEGGRAAAAATPGWISPLAGQYEGTGFADLRAVRAGEAMTSGAEREALRHLYQTEVDFAAWWTRELLEAARHASGDRELVWVVTSDHGEEFFDEGGFEHGHSLGDAVLRVPLVAGGLGESPQVLRLIDVGPRILDRLGVADGFDAAPGTGLLDSDLALRPYALGGPSPFAPCERPQMMAEGLLYGPPRTRFTLADGRVVERVEPDGVLEFAGGCAEPDRVGSSEEAPWQQLDLWRERRGISPRSLELNDDLRRQLRALGYIR